MIVLDASAITELLLQTELGDQVERRLYDDDDDLHAPHLLDVEVLSALRRLVRTGEVMPERAKEAIEDLAYDAMYLALAESLDAPVVTCDLPFGTAARHSANIDVIRPARHREE